MEEIIVILLFANDNLDSDIFTTDNAKTVHLAKSLIQDKLHTELERICDLKNVIQGDLKDWFSYTTDKFFNGGYSPVLFLFYCAYMSYFFDGFSQCMLKETAEDAQMYVLTSVCAWLEEHMKTGKKTPTLIVAEIVKAAENILKHNEVIGLVAKSLEFNWNCYGNESVMENVESDSEDYYNGFDDWIINDIDLKGREKAYHRILPSSQILYSVIMTAVGAMKPNHRHCARSKTTCVK